MRSASSRALLIDGWAGTGGGVLGGVVGALSAAAVVRGASRRGATVGGTAFLLAAAGIVVAALALIPVVGFVEAVVIPAARGAAGTERPGEVRGPPFAREMTPRPLILVVIDGLTPVMLEAAIASGRTPTLAAIAARRKLPPGDLGVPVADAGLPGVDRHGRPRRRARDPAPRLVPPG